MLKREYRGVFVVLEGIDGSGKTTIAKLLIEKLRGRGYRAEYTYEPTSSEIVEVVRTKYRDVRDAYIDALTFALDRLIHLKTQIIPLLEEGYIVVSDRYLYSSVAYQTASGAPLEWVFEVNKWALQPDIAIYLDVEPERGLIRRAQKQTRFPEFEKLEFVKEVRRIYLELVKRGLLVLIDANRELDEVFRDVETLVVNTIVKKFAS